MAGGLTVSVRQISSYPLSPAGGGDVLLIQQGGLGGPYASTNLAGLLTPLNQGDVLLGLGITPPAGAVGGQMFADGVALSVDGSFAWNGYFNGGWHYLENGLAALLNVNQLGAFAYSLAPAGQTGNPVQAWIDLFRISPAGNAQLPQGTLSVARDPGSALEVATMGWVARSTVVSFNGRVGAVSLLPSDLEAVLGYPLDCIATIPQVNQIVCAAIQDLIHTYPAVWSFNGRVGDVWFRVWDFNYATMAPGAPAAEVPTPEATSNDNTVPDTAWVNALLATYTGGNPGPFATESWVEAQIAASVISFNGRNGAVTLTLADVTGAGGAPAASPNFSGIPTGPTANTGTSTAQLATTAYVMNTLTAISPGVIAFNGRSGAVTLDATDINDAGGALLASPNFTGTPAAPTAPNGTSTSQIATTAFVMNELTAISAGVVSFNGRSGVVLLSLNDIMLAGGAPLTSPVFTGVPSAPTAANGNNTTQLATTAFVQNAINAVDSGVTTFNGRSGSVTLTQNDVTAVGGLVNPSPALSGTPTAPTPAPTDSSTNIATTAFVKAALASAAGATVSPTAPPSPNTGALWFNTGVTPPQLNVWNGSAWVVTINTSGYAPLASPALTGTPSAPTATPATLSTTQIATTAFVQNAIAAGGFATTTQLAGYVPLAGNVTMTGNLTMGPSGTNSVNLQLANGSLVFNGNQPFGTTAVNYIQNGIAGAINLNGTAGLTLYAAPSGTAGGGITFSPMVNITPTSVTLSGNVGIPGGLNVGAGGITNAGSMNIGANLSLTSATSTLSCYNLVASASANLVGVQFTSGATVSPPSNGAGTVGQAALAWNSMSSFGFNQVSDQRGKLNIAPYAGGVSIVSQLLPKTFSYDWDATAAEHLGFVAQDVEGPLPLAVTGSEATAFGLDVVAIVAVLANAVKQLINRVVALEANASITPSAAETA